MKSINKINNIYKSEVGDKLAVEELLPLVKKYVKVENPKILEVGCGYGRNLFALSHLKNSEVVGCDISKNELKKAQIKMDKYGIKNVQLSLQTDNNKLPFVDNSFDLVVMWQVLEHVFSEEEKKNLINEVMRVLKKGGYVLIETPNWLFPFDYHDNNLPLVHWVFPDCWRQFITTRIRKEKFPPSQYTTICQIKKFISKSSYIKSFKQVTKIYFEESYLDIFRHLGGTRKGFKVLFFLLYAPMYYTLRIMGFSGDTLTPSIRVIFKVDKKCSKW